MPPILKLLFRFVPAFGLVAALVWPACLLVQADIRLRALAALGGFGQPGLAVSVEGRNLRLSGQASGASSLLDARKGLAGVDGVRILLVSASVESPAVPSDPVETAPIEPVAVAYLVNDEPTRPEPALVLPVRVVPEPAARKLRRALPVPCTQWAVQMWGRKDAGQGMGAPACRVQRINSGAGLSPAE